MIKIFGYELKRILKSWLFLAMLIANGVFAWIVLSTEIIMGIAYTAPFSVWSYCAYIGKTMLIAMITVLLMLAGYYGKKQKQVEILTLATPITPAQQLILRTVVLGVCFAILCVETAVLAAVFYSSLFRYTSFGVYVMPYVLLVVPCFLFATGLGHILGRVHQCLVYLLLAILFIVGLCGITNAFDLFGVGYFSTYPLTLPVDSSGEALYVMDGAWVTARLVYLAIGVLLFVINVRIKHKPTRA